MTSLQNFTSEQLLRRLYALTNDQAQLAQRLVDTYSESHDQDTRTITTTPTKTAVPSSFYYYCCDDGTRVIAREKPLVAFLSDPDIEKSSFGRLPETPDEVMSFITAEKEKVEAQEQVIKDLRNIAIRYHSLVDLVAGDLDAFSCVCDDVGTTTTTIRHIKQRLGLSEHNAGNWNPLLLMCHAIGVVGDGCGGGGAVYIKSQRLVKFYSNGGVHACRYRDVAVHELSHVILDAIKPDMYSAKSGQVGALHEAFADMMVVFDNLSSAAACERITTETLCKLRRSTELTCIGREYATDVTRRQEADTGTNNDGEHIVEVFGLRDMNNTLMGSNMDKVRDIHRLSCIFSGFMFDVISQRFEESRAPTFGLRDAETLMRVSRLFRRIFIYAFVVCESATPDFSCLVDAMVKVVTSPSLLSDVMLSDGLVDSRDRLVCVIEEHRHRRELGMAGVRHPHRRSCSDLDGV